MLECFKWLNIFQFCKWLKLLGHVMVLLVVGIIGMSYYAVVIDCYGPYVFQAPSGRAACSFFAIFLFTFLVGMSLWSYFAAAMTCPGHVPTGWHPFQDDATAQAEMERLRMAADNDRDRDRNMWERRNPHRPRYCKRCQAWKPERAHHCSASGRCVLKMDHYCIWVVNCVGLLNYKHFLLFLFYTFWAATLAMFLLLPYVIQFFQDVDSDISPITFLALVVDAAFSLSLAGFLIMHQQMVAENMTTIETYEKEHITPWPYNKGRKRNFEEVFGRVAWRRFIPSHTREEKRAMLDTYLNAALLAGNTFSSHV